METAFIPAEYTAKKSKNEIRGNESMTKYETRMTDQRVRYL